VLPCNGECWINLLKKKTEVSVATQTRCLTRHFSTSNFLASTELAHRLQFEDVLSAQNEMKGDQACASSCRYWKGIPRVWSSCHYHRIRSRGQLTNLGVEWGCIRCDAVSFGEWLLTFLWNVVSQIEPSNAAPILARPSSTVKSVWDQFRAANFKRRTHQAWNVGVNKD
jgi:hypothetical protein